MSAFLGPGAPHVRPAPTGAARAAVAGASHVMSAFSDATRVEASGRHHPLSGDYAPPRPAGLIGGSKWSWGPSGWSEIANDPSASPEDRARAREALAVAEENRARWEASKAPAAPAPSGPEPARVHRTGLLPTVDTPETRAMAARLASGESRRSGRAAAMNAARLAATFGNMPFRGALRRAAMS